MSDYIEREKALKAVEDIVCDADDAERTCDRIIDIPAADVAPIRHGRWINCEWVESGFKFVCCSECNHADMDSRLYKYCPWCGARMDEEADDE